MAYNAVGKLGDLVLLAEEVWSEHIQSHHPEVTMEDIRLTLVDPDEVQQSQSRIDVELYYRLKDSSTPSRVRYWLVVVKKISRGNFVSSAMTKTKIVGSKMIYRKL